MAVKKVTPALVSKPKGLFILSHGTTDIDGVIQRLATKEKKGVNLDMTMVCRGDNRADGTPTALIIGSYDRKTEVDDTMVQDVFFAEDKSDQLTIPPLDPQLTCTLLWDNWEVDPSTVGQGEELMAYVGGHGVLNFEKWFEAFTSTQHDKEFPGAVRTLAGEGESHPDGTKTCVFVHVFRKSCEQQVRDQLLFGEEKSLLAKEKSVVMPWYPDSYGTICHMNK